MALGIVAIAGISVLVILVIIKHYIFYIPGHNL